MALKYKGIRINYNDEGTGSVIVLLHGFLESIHMWDDLAAELCNDYRIIRIDLLGHGETGCIGYIHTMEDMADAVYTVLNHLNVGKASFIGHSMGGYVALELAKKVPQLFKSLCLMNSTFESDDEERKVIRTRANKMVQANFENMVRLSFANLFTPKSRVLFKDAFEHALQLALQTPLQGYIAAQEGMKIRQDHFELYSQLKSRKLIIIGKKDPVVNGDAIISKIENTDIDYVEFSEGHMSHIENKSELSYNIKHFIENL